MWPRGVPLEGRPSIVRVDLTVVCDGSIEQITPTVFFRVSRPSSMAKANTCSWETRVVAELTLGLLSSRILTIVHDSCRRYLLEREFYDSFSLKCSSSRLKGIKGKIHRDLALGTLVPQAQSDLFVARAGQTRLRPKI